jgi:serine/threonine protein kinase
MAPEQLRGEGTDARSDFWAAGAVLFEMATGQRPFPEIKVPQLIDCILNKSPKLPAKVNHKLSPGLEDVILRIVTRFIVIFRWATAPVLLLVVRQAQTEGAPSRGLNKRVQMGAFIVDHQPV